MGLLPIPRPPSETLTAAVEMPPLPALARRDAGDDGERVGTKGDSGTAAVIARAVPDNGPEYGCKGAGKEPSNRPPKLLRCLPRPYGGKG